VTGTGPQKIPGAMLTQFYGTGRYSGSPMEVNVGVVHTTEGMTLPDYGGGAMAPTVTAVPDFKAKKLRYYQHFDVDESARALANKPGGVQTNTANAFQIELVGTCDVKHQSTWGTKISGKDYIYWPLAPEWCLKELAWLVRWLNVNHKIPLTCAKDWLAYGKDGRRPGVVPASYGNSPVRMTGAEWTRFTGWCGHMHVPENDHGDPGNMNFARVLELVKQTSAPVAKYHTVKTGDTLYGIASKYSTTVAALRKLNPRYVSDSLIGLNDKIRVR
jgi:LysM repeat protein